MCKRSEAAVAAAGGIKLGRVLACVGTFILQLRRLRAARAAMATEEVATGDDVATVEVSTAVAAAGDAATDEPPALAPAPALALAPALTSAGEQPPVAAPGDASGRSWAGVAAVTPAAAAAASAEKRRVEFDAEQSPARRGRAGADSPPVPSIDEESRQLEGKLSALCAQCRRSEQNS